MRTNYLPDVNVWLALSFRQHAHHEPAARWFVGIGDDAGCSFCRITQQALLRLSTNPKVVGTEARRLPDAWHLYDQITRDARVGFADEPPGLEAGRRALTQSPKYSPNVWADAYLAAFAKAGGYEVVTFDRGFEQFGLARLTILS